MNHRFFVMADGFASVRRALGSTVHGLLWDLALRDVATLDRFEDVASGQYAKVMHPVVKPGGAVKALVYIGRAVETGLPRPGYLETIIAAARALDLPDNHVQALAAILRQGSHGPAFVNAPTLTPGSARGVRPRFASPHERT